jgi:hypothetical protein
MTKKRDNLAYRILPISYILRTENLDGVNVRVWGRPRISKDKTDSEITYSGYLHDKNSSIAIKKSKAKQYLEEKVELSLLKMSEIEDYPVLLQGQLKGGVNSGYELHISGIRFREHASSGFVGYK